MTRCLTRTRRRRVALGHESREVTCGLCLFGLINRSLYVQPTCLRYLRRMVQGDEDGG